MCLELRATDFLSESIDRWTHCLYRGEQSGFKLAIEKFHQVQ